MKATAIRPVELTQEQILIWRQYQQQHPMTLSPFFSPEYIQAVSSARRDIEIGIVETDGQIAGFFPFQRTSWNIATPVGGRICDFSGILMRSDIEWRPDILLRRLRLRAWKFTNAPADMHVLQSHHDTRSEAPCLDLSGGFNGYCEERTQSGSALISEIRRKSRNLQRDHGQLRVVLNTTDQSVMDALLRWKAEQRRKTNSSDVLSLNWVLRTLDYLRAIQRKEFAGMLSVLYAGEQMAAIHLGMRSSAVLHYWFPTYNIELGKYSPGSILLLETARMLSEQGLQRIDLGRGGEHYKGRFESARLQIARGSIDRTLSCRIMTAVLRSGRHWAKRTPLAEFLYRTKHAATRAMYFTSNLLER
jgi:CelD/BcsL family acetyltransferase involved in cellulose biosynthesis